MKKTPNYIPKPPQEGSKTLQNGRSKREEIDVQHEQRSQRASETIFELNMTPKCFQNDARRPSEWPQQECKIQSPKNAPLVAQRFWHGLRWSKRRLQSTKSRKESLWDGLGPEIEGP